MNSEPYEIVIGLEVHVQLATRSKLFSRVSTTFGAEPNAQTSVVCIGMPGALPVMNREAFRLGLIVGLSLNCEIPEVTRWDRKHYYYPDLPKGYQISQYDRPLNGRGWLEISDVDGQFETKRIGIRRAHLEEDAGKSMHDERRRTADSRIDLNRAGTPLLEIVTEPDLRSPAEAKVFLNELKLILSYAGVSDCNMQEGSLRVDANVNVHVRRDDGSIAATPLVEIKNMNSFRAVERAIAYEAARQYDAWLDDGKTIGDAPKQTRGWDDGAQVTRPQRTKEESSDYRYFPDPDLPPAVVTAADLDRLRASLGEAPQALRERLQSQYGLTYYDADVMVDQGRAFVVYFEELAAASGDARRSANWMQQEILKTLNERGIEFAAFSVPPAELADLIRRQAAGDLDSSKAREIFARLFEQGGTTAEAVDALGFVRVDRDELEALCEELVAANPKVVQEVAGGKAKAIGALVGQAKKRNPNVSPGEVEAICLKIIARVSASS